MILGIIGKFRYNFKHNKGADPEFGKRWCTLLKSRGEKKKQP